MRHTWTFLVGCAVAMVLVSAAFGQTPAGTSLDEAVQKAIEKGVANLWSQCGANGAWPAYGGGTHTYTVGPTALAAYALLESGASPQDEKMGKTLEFLAKNDDNKNYSVALRCQVWLIANRQTGNKYQKEFEADVKRMIRGEWEGAYTYDANGDGRRHGFDNSNAQFGVLGVWAGARQNLEFIEDKYWWKVMKHWIDGQCADGGWGYLGAQESSRASMTAAGVATLFVCMDNLLSDAFIKCDVAQKTEFKAVERGLDWLDTNFQEQIHNPAAYYLYALERVSLASGYKYFGSADWYKQGAQLLVRRQRPDGGWGNMSDTCFSLLFLIRGRNPILFNKLQYNGDWNNRPRALATLTDWMSRSIERTVNWQIINMKAPVTEWHDAPVLLICGSKAPTFSEEDLDKLRTYVQQGGTILSVTECNGSAFNKGMRDACKKLFPDYEMKLADKDHELYRIQFPLKARSKFHLVSNGIRPLVIHVEEDMSLPWQTRQDRTESWAYEGAENVYLYVTDKPDLKDKDAIRARGVSNWPEPSAGEPSKKVKVVRLKYGGNWDPEPLAYERLGRLLAQEAGVGIELSVKDIKEAADSGAQVATLTGTAALRVNADDKEALKKFVEGGGILLVDAAGGSRTFAESAESLIEEIWGAGSLKRLPRDSPIYTVKAISEYKYRRQTKSRLRGDKEPQLRGVTVAQKRGVIYSREDLTGGLVGYACYGCDGYAPPTAYAIVRNIMVMAAGGEGIPVPASKPADSGDNEPAPPPPPIDPGGNAGG